MASVRILGPIEAWSGQRRLEIGGPRQLALLAFLVVNANRAVPADVIVDSLWGAGRSGSDNRLPMAVTRLRRALAPLDGPRGAVLRTVSGGYLLALEPTELDAETFTRRIQEGIAALQTGEAEDARASLIEALAMWRGPPLAEVAFEDFAQAEIRRLEELRLTAVESRFEAELRLGHHAQLVGELEGLLAEDATRERLATLLMLALYRSGRQKEALEVFHRIRVHLAAELGIEPGPALRQLQAQILEQAPSLLAQGDGRSGPRAPALSGAVAGAAVTPSGSEAPHVTAPLPGRLAPHGPRAFVNRRVERAALAEAIEAVARAGPRAAIVTGEPGIGKTRLVSEVARHAHDSGRLVLAGRCDERLELPYIPFVEALEHLIGHAPSALLEAHVARYGDSLTRLVPGLGRRAATPATPESPASDFERFALFRAVEGLLEAACAGAPVVVVLEDLHWGDPGTLQLLWRLLSSPRTMPLMLLATCRTSDVDEEHPLRQFLADAHREPNVTRLDLAGLGIGDIAELLRVIGNGAVQGPDQELVHALQSSTDGNPFFITQLARSLLESGELSHADGRWHLDGSADMAGRLPLSISETLAARVRRLGESSRACLAVAAVLGEEFDLDLVAEVADVPSPADALDLGVRRSVLLEIVGRPGRFRFVHALMQRYLYRDLGSATRTELHRRVAEAMEARSDEGRWAAAELARHWLAAGEREWRNALRYASLAGDEALAQLAPDEARRWYETAIELLGRHAGVPQSELCDLLVRRGEAERQAGDLRFRETLLQAAELAQRIGEGQILVRAALANSRGMQSQTGVVDELRIAILQAALEIVGTGDSPQRAQLLAMHAAELMYAPDSRDRIRLSDDALAIARRLDDPDALITVLNMRFVSLLTADTHSERLANTIEAVAAAERLRSSPARFYAYHWRAYACIEAGDIPVARTWLIREREIAEAFRQPTALWLARADEANLAIVAGDLEAADRLAADAFAIGRESEPDAAACFAAQRTSIAFASARLGELAPLLAQTVADNPGVPGFRAILALAQLQAGHREEAEELLAAAAAVAFSEVPRDVTWLAVMCIYAQVAAQLEVVATAAVLYELLAPWEGQLAFPAFGVWGPVALHLGSLAVCGGDVAAAERHLSQAREEAEHAGAPLWRTWAESLLSQLAETAR